MRILFVLENYLPHIGGVEIVFANLCEGLAKAGHDVTVLTHQLPKTKRKEVRNGVRIIRVPCLDSRYLFTFAAIPEATRLARHADIIHTTTYNGAFPAWVAARRSKRPVIITVHETWLGKWREYANFSWPVALVHEFLEWCVYRIPRFDRYVCVSESTRKMFTKAIPAYKEKTLTIHNGFEPAMWKRPQPQPIAQIRRDLQLEGKFVIFASGRPGTTKGFEYLVNAFWKVKHEIPNAQLILMLAKDKQYRHKIKEFRTYAHPETLFVDPQPFTELPAWRQLADCVVVPSVTEGFGYAVLESVATGTPVVATDTTSIPEVIFGKHVLVEPKNAEALAEGIIKIHAKKYRTTAERKFPWTATIKRYTRLYEELT